MGVPAELIQEPRRERSAEAAERPFPRMPTETCADWIEDDVARQFEKVRVALDQAGIEAALEDVAGVAMAPVEPARIVRVKSLHSGRKVRRGRLEHDVVVVRHLAVGVADPSEVILDVSKQRRKPPEVQPVLIEPTAPHASGSDVVEAAGNVRAQGSRHAPTVRLTRNGL